MYMVKLEKGNKYIDNVPMLKWGEWRDNTYCGSIAMAANILDIPASYEYIMGVSGLCYRFAMKPDSCPSSALVQNGTVWDENINKALGIEMYSMDDDIKRDENVKNSISSGVPVICMGQIGPPEWGIIAGYSENDKTFFGRSYFDSQNIHPSNPYFSNDNIFYTENNYCCANDYPGVYPKLFMRFFDRSCAKDEPIELLKKSLEICLKYYEHNEFNECKFGESAINILIDNLKKSDRGSENYHLGILADARCSAYVYLKESASLLKGKNQEKLKNVSLLYKSVKDRIISVVPYEMLTDAFNGNPKEPWNSDICKKLIDVLYEIIDTEKQIQILVKDILANW